MTWPEALVAELAARRCIVFLGAGASAASKNASGDRPPSWEGLLTRAKDLLPASPDKVTADELIKEKRFLDAAEVVFSTIDPSDKTAFFRSQFQQPAFTPSSLHTLVRDLDAKVVITTNYDTLYDRLCPPDDGYNVRKYTDEHLLDDIRSPVRLILKAHGCITDPQRIVVTRSDYYTARSRNSRFYNVLDALFLTSTILFIGCSLADPDIQLTLENSNIAAAATHSHFALLANGTHPALSRAIRQSYNIRLVEYNNDAGDHANAETELRRLVEDVESYRLSMPA